MRFERRLSFPEQLLEPGGRFLVLHRTFCVGFWSVVHTFPFCVLPTVRVYWWHHRTEPFYSDYCQDYASLASRCAAGWLCIMGLWSFSHLLFSSPAIGVYLPCLPVFICQVYWICKAVSSALRCCSSVPYTHCHWCRCWSTHYLVCRSSETESCAKVINSEANMINVTDVGSRQLGAVLAGGQAKGACWDCIYQRNCQSLRPRQLSCPHSASQLCVHTLWSLQIILAHSPSMATIHTRCRQ